MAWVKSVGMGVVAGLAIAALPLVPAMGADGGVRNPNERWWSLMRTEALSAVPMEHDRWPYLGLLVGDAEEAAEEHANRSGAAPLPPGALVTEIAADGPAAVAGLRVGDVITKVAEAEVGSASDLVHVVFQQRVGSALAIEYARRGKTRSAVIVVAEAKLDSPVGDDDEAKIGVTVHTVTEAMATSLGLAPEVAGVAVVDVGQDSPAAASGLRKGDVITQIDGQAVTSAREAADALRAGGKKVRHLQIWNSGGARSILVTPR